MHRRQRRATFAGLTLASLLTAACAPSSPAVSTNSTTTSPTVTVARHHRRIAINVTAPTSTTIAPATTAAPSTTTTAPVVKLPTTTAPAVQTPTTTAPAASLPAVGAPSDAGLTVAASSLKTWTGATTITPTTAGVVNGVVDGYLFTSTIRVNGNVTFTNDKFAFVAPWHIIVQGTATPGPVFSHIEVDGQNMGSGNDDNGITNSSRDNGGVQGVTASPFTLDRSHLHHLINGTRLDSGATVTNTLIDHLWVFGGSHTDGTEIYCGSNITIDHTTIDATGSGTNAAIETQGDAATGGFCPVSNLTFSNDLFSGGSATWRLDDSSITHVTVRNLTVVAGSFYYFATAITTPSQVDVWQNVKLSNGTTIPTAETYGCGAWTSCN